MVGRGTIEWDGTQEITAGDLSVAITAMTTQVDELYTLAGLASGDPMTVTPTSRTTSAITLDITGDGVTTTTVTRA